MDFADTVLFSFSPFTPDNYTEFAIRGGNNSCHVLLATDYQIHYRRWESTDGNPTLFGNAYDFVVGSGSSLTLAAYLTSPLQALGCWRDSSGPGANAFCAVFTDGGTSITPFQVGTAGVASIQALVLANPERSVIIFGLVADLKPTLFKTTGTNPRDFSQNTTQQFGFSTSLQAGTVTPGLLSVTYTFSNLLSLLTYDENTLTPSTQFIISNNLTNVVDPRYTTMTPAFSSPFSFMFYFDPSGPRKFDSIESFLKYHKQHIS